VAKDEASTYEQGPTRRWPKVKQSGWTVEGDGGGGSAWRRRPVDRQLTLGLSRTGMACGRLPAVSLLSGPVLSPCVGERSTGIWNSNHPPFIQR
jgi:hypothetical protein